MKIFLDSAQPNDVRTWADRVDGFTTNPSLMHSAGAKRYGEVIAYFQSLVDGKSLSVEVVADDWYEMARQALVLSGMGPNVYVKIPIVTTNGASTAPLIDKLARQGIKLNITAMMTSHQVQLACEALRSSVPSIVSIFAGRIADTGRDPIPLIQTSKVLARQSGSEVLWASAREALNISQAESAGCDIITLTPALLEKRNLQGKNLDDYSRETVQMFYDDAVAAGLTL